MNKKFSTLMAGFLLAGGLFSTANAIDVRTAQPGQYYKLKRTAQFSTSASTPAWSDVASSNDFIGNKGGKIVLVNDADDSNLYWKIEKRTNIASTDVRLVNVATGKAIKISDGTNSTEWFAVKYNQIPSMTEDVNELVWGASLDNYLALKEITGTSGEYEVVSATTSSTDCFLQALNAVPVPATEYTATTINAIKGEGFGLQIGYINDKDKYVDYTLQGGTAFAGELKAYDAVSNVSDWAADSDSKTFYLYNKSAKKYIVLLNEKWTSNGTTDLIGGTAGKGYKFGLMTAQQVKADFAKAAADRVIKSGLFSITAPANADKAPLEVAIDNLELFVAEVAGKYYLTTSENNATKEAEYANETYVKFGLGNMADWSKFYGKAINIIGIKGTNNGKTIVPNDGDAWEDADYVAFSKPEGQWIVTEGTEGVVFTNRETQEEADASFFASLRNDSGDVYYVDADNQYKITACEVGGESFGFYGILKADNENAGEPQTYAITFINKVTGEPNYVGFDGEGKLVLTSKAAAAINFKAVATKTTDIEKEDGSIDANNKATDVFRIINDIMVYDKDAKAWELKEDGDTVSYYRYKLEYNGKYLANDGDKLALVASANADNYVVKLKEGNVVNVINVETTDFDDLTNTASEVLDANMLYFDFNHAELKQAKNIYNWVANAQLELQGNAPVVYRTFAAPDTLEFFRTEFADEFLFENGEFLGMTYNREKYNPSIFVDTAYVRGETKKPFYMLAVGVDKTDASKICPICGKADCEHAVDVPGMIAARYLVALTDSAAAYRTQLSNKFYYSGTKWEKLGFVPAVHHVDTLVITNDKHKVIVGNKEINPAKFAFRIVNAETEDFVIETAMRVNQADASKGYKIAYVKWHNGCPVLTEDLKDAEVFNVRETSAKPTANEGIATSEVTVIAGEGQLTIANAAGKKVVVSNILGQVVANTVLTSDNAVIAAPQGVVVVAVEGEEAVKAIVK